MNVTFEIEDGPKPAAPWMVKAGMLVVKTVYTHPHRLVVTLRPTKVDQEPIDHWDNLKKSMDLGALSQLERPCETQAAAATSTGTPAREDSKTPPGS